jgi:uncharacterized OB-fold protein
MAYISIPTYWKSLPQRYKLVGCKCEGCGKILFPPRNFCDSCGGKIFSEFRLSGDGEVITNTIIARGAAPPEFIEQQKKAGSFAVVIVKLSEGPTIIAQMTDCDPNDVKIGMKVESVIRKIYEQEGVIRYGFKFRPKRS